jgi:hemolysin activation/secretion protein
MRWRLKLTAVWVGVLVSGLTGFSSRSVVASTSLISTGLASTGLASTASPIDRVTDVAQVPPTIRSDPQPDDRFLQPNPQPVPVLPAETTPVMPTPVPPPPAPSPQLSPQPDVQISVRRIEVIGSTVFSPADFAPIVQPSAGQTLTLEQLRSVADQITQLYLDRGYITSRAILVDQTIQDGLVQIRVIEGAIERIDIEGNHHVNASYIRSRVQLSGHTPLNQTSLEDQLRLLRLDPLFKNVEASLQAGSGLGLSILAVRVTEANPPVSSLSVDNFSPRDSQGAWGLRSLLSLGTGLFDATTNSGDLPDGQFFAWLGQVQRVQVLNDSNLLILQTDIQLTPDGLLPSQVFTIGGGQSLRGYRQNVRSGDNGFRISAEDRITIQRNEAGAATIQVAPFIDVGAVWDVDNNPNPPIDQSFLAGAGLGLLWEPFPGLNLRADFTLPLVNLSDRGVNTQDDGFYFSVVYQP